MAIGTQYGGILKSLVMVVMVFVMLILNGGSAFAEMAAKPDVGPKGGMFSVIGHSYQGEYLVIKYTVKYPGMTKVRMFDNDDNLVWRSQYVNDTIGEHKVVLKASYMKPGNYRFEFEYKNEFDNVIVMR